MTSDGTTKKAYEKAREQYAAWGVDTQGAMDLLEKIALSLHCWQGDDVGGFETADAALTGGGIQVTGSHPGKARNPEELRADLKKAGSLIPGQLRLNLHALYGEFGGATVDRDAIEARHYQGWIDWAKAEKVKLDFNASCFSHPRADQGFTLSSTDPGTRAFWIEHVKRCREISAVMGRAQESPCLHNLWIPDGAKDLPADRWKHRRLLTESLDEIFSIRHSDQEMIDALESKLFGLGSEAFVVGSHEFYMGYALTRGKMICLDMGHFHPTESVADKISALLQFCPALLLHVSRGVRWDSDHVVILSDELEALAQEVVRGGALDRVHLALDFFDASINRIGAWVIGARATLKALLLALLEPREKIIDAEESGDLFARLALMEEMKTQPIGAVWDFYCLQKSVPRGEAWIREIQAYEATVTSKRK